MSETGNAINLLVQLGIDTNASKTNLDKQIENLSKQLSNLDIKVDIDKEAIKALNELSKIDLKGLSESIKGAGKGLGGVGDEAKQTGNEIKKNFSDVQKSLDTTFNHLSKDFQQAMKKGIVSADELQKAFAGMNASFKMDYEVIGEDSAGQQIRRVKNIEASFKNLQGQMEKVKFNNNSAIDMGNGELQNLWLPENTSKVIDSQMKQVETSISNAVKKSQEELHKLVRSGEITEQQFYELSKASSNIMHPNSIHLYNQRLTETISGNKQLTLQKKEQLVVEEKIRKLQNSIVTAQNRDPKGMGSNSSVREMLDTLNKIDPASTTAATKVKDVSDNFSRLKAESVSAGRESLTVLDSFKIAMEKFPVWMAASTVFYQTVRSASDAVQQIVQLDSQLTVLRRVGGSGIDVNKVLEESIRLAGELGNQISDINDGFIAFARQGFKGEELTMLAEYATLLGNISDLSVDESASILTAGLKAFNMETERGIHIVNALNEVDNSFSVTTNQLAMSMQRSAGTASVYGSTLERLIGYTTAIAEITRESGSVIGNSLKSVFSRITSVSGAIDALDGIGISIYTQAGEMRKVDDILDDLGAQWNSLNAEQQQNIGLQVAGKRTCQPIQKWIVKNVLNSGKLQRWTTVSEILTRRRAEIIIHCLTI
ncbi:phage tail tape measure protein [Lederbergia citrisecunda]|uniref:phage tail tape measure protein n=1 Tax=Lederbergia citrisecunda TaxID=2833583 RepID=UPI003D26FCFB